MSTLFNLKVPTKNEPDETHHPWEKTIKEVYSSKIKRAHNSILNPPYPEENKVPTKEKIQFTVIGDRVTKEFIYCVHVVLGLHKYRTKKFETPIIRGVTSVEWPQVWNELKLQYGGVAFCIPSPVVVLMNNQFLGGDQELKKLLDSKYIYHLCLDYYKESVDQFTSFVKNSGRPFVYIHVSVDGQHIGTMIFMLYSDIVPKTCENFLRLCASRRGGYSGTPIHRIVKDCWVQCGGFGLKSTELDCENFIVPHDKRGVLCMANDGRHVDCSTQFFVLLQPAPWMAHKYVAFGQLIEGVSTLKKIEEQPTWFEAPTVDIVMYQTGILNLDYHGITISKGTKEYIEGHIEDLTVLGDYIYEALLENVFLDIEFRKELVLTLLENVFLEIEFKRIAALDMGGEEVTEEEKQGVHPTKRFRREDIETELKKSQVDQESLVGGENNDFDVEVYSNSYNYEPEEISYDQISHPTSPELKPVVPFYIPLTDVPYPGEKDSNFDLKRFLQGDYCLESELDREPPRKQGIKATLTSFDSEMLFRYSEEFGTEPDSVTSLDSEDEREIKKYVKLNSGRVSFAGDIVRGIARGPGKVNLFEGARKSEMISLTDDELRRARIASVVERRRSSAKKVSSTEIQNVSEGCKVRRRPTVFPRQEVVDKIDSFDSGYSFELASIEEESSAIMTRKVRIAPDLKTQERQRISKNQTRRPTAYVRPSLVPDDDDDDHGQRSSTLHRLFEEVDINDSDERGPTFKDLKSMSQTRNKNILLTMSTPLKDSRETPRERILRHSAQHELLDVSIEQIYGVQHGHSKVARKISSDYAKMLDLVQHKEEKSIRSVEFARSRPALTVIEYQEKNKHYAKSLSEQKGVEPREEYSLYTEDSSLASSK